MDLICYFPAALLLTNGGFRGRAVGMADRSWEILGIREIELDKGLLFLPGPGLSLRTGELITWRPASTKPFGLEG